MQPFSLVLAGAVPALSVRAFAHAGLVLVPLGLGAGSSVAAALDHEDVRVRLAERHRHAPMPAVLDDLARHDAAGGSVHWAVYRDRGACGLVGLRPIEGALRTVTLLGPRGRGSGVNPHLKQVLWASAQELGMGLVARCNADNVRSRRAIEKLWPQVAATRIDEPERARTMLVYALDAPPAGGAQLDTAARAALRGHLRCFPLCERLLGAPQAQMAA